VRALYDGAMAGRSITSAMIATIIVAVNAASRVTLMLFADSSGLGFSPTQRSCPAEPAPAEPGAGSRWLRSALGLSDDEAI
jgi:hypothetical protein